MPTIEQLPPATTISPADEIPLSQAGVARSVAVGTLLSGTQPAILAQTGVLLARAEGEDQVAAIGSQHAGRVGFFLRVDDFDAGYERMRSAGVEFLTEPRTEPYGRVVVFRDVAGNRWDLLGLAATSPSASPGPRPCPR